MEFVKETVSDSLSTVTTQYSDSVDEFSGNTIELFADAPVELSKLKNAVHFVQTALNEEITPMLVDDCTGGTYMCLNKYEGVEAVFKPCDEEPYCVNNPKGLSPNQLSENNRGIIPGTSYLREIAAYYLDHNHFAGVPETALACISYESSNYEVRRKVGSLQLFVSHECSSEDYGPSMFSLENIQRIALHDIRLMNLDRHENNLLVCNTRTHRSLSLDYSGDYAYSTRPSRSGSFSRPSHLHLIPIDHGYSLPDMTTPALPEWCWMRWLHSQAPLSQEAKEYIRSLDINSDIALLKSFVPHLEESALNTLRITTLWLQLCATTDCSLHQIAQFFFATEKQSPFQTLVNLYTAQYPSMLFEEYLNTVGKDYMVSLLPTQLSSFVC